MVDKYFIYHVNELDEVYNLFFHESEQEINNRLLSLKDWINKEPHLPQNEEEHVFRKMLALNKFSVEKTKRKLEVFYSGKNFLPEFFENYSPMDKRVQKAMKLSIYLPLPCLMGTHERVVIMKFCSKKNIDDFNMEDYMRTLFMSTELRLMSNDMSLGDHILVDLSDATVQVVAKCTPRLLQNCMSYITGAYADRIKSINFMNVPSYAFTTITLLKSMVKNKLIERVQVHKDLDSLYKIIPKCALPKDYGGDLNSTEKLKSDWHKFLENNDSVIKERSKMRSTEKLRIGEAVKSELFGLQGSFQKLIID